MISLNFISNILDKLETNFGTNKIVSILISNENGSESIHIYGVVIEKKGTEISIQENFHCSSILDLKNMVGNKLPIVICYCGHGIINKISYTKSKENLTSVFPGLDLNTIYYQVIGLESSTKVTSVIKKKIVDDLIIQFKNDSFQVVNFILGEIFSIPILADSISTNSEFVLNDSVLKFENYSLVSIQKNSSNLQIDYKIFSDTISSKFVSSFCYGIFYFKPYLKHESNFEFVFAEQTKLRNEKVRNAIIGIGGVVMFVMAFINFLVFQNLYSSKNELSNKINIVQTNSQAFSNSKNQIKIRKDIFRISSKPLSNTYLMNTISKSLVGGVVLSQIELYPKTNSANDSLYFESNSVLVTGFFNSSNSFNQFIEKLKQNKNYKGIEILYLKKDELKQKETFKMIIKI